MNEVPPRRPSHKDSEPAEISFHEVAGEIKEIMRLFDILYAQIKIFSLGHENVQRFISQFYERLTEYLDKNWKLEIEVEEFSFSVMGNEVYREDKIKKSLPFLFFKDGLQTFFFYKGLKREEIEALFEIIKIQFLLPSEESDIVVALWEKDFANIRYIAPDEFLSSKIGIGMESKEYELDLDRLFKGSITLKREDRALLEQQRQKSSQPADESTASMKTFGSSVRITADNVRLNEEELEKLEEMVRANRELESEDEFIALFLEMLYLDERSEQFSIILEALTSFLQDILKKGHFKRAAKIHHYLLELKEEFAESQKEKSSLLVRFLHDLRGPEVFTSVQSVFKNRLHFEIDDFFDYIHILGPEVISLLYEAYDISDDPAFRRRVLDYIKGLTQKDPALVFKILGDDRHEITHEFLSAVNASRDVKALPYLANFAHYKTTSIRKAAVDALRRFDDSTAQKILFSFLDDEDEKIRISAAQGLKSIQDSRLLRQFLRIFKSKEFHLKSREERRAFLEALVVISPPEASHIFHGFCRSAGLLSNSKKLDTIFLAVEVLKGKSSEESQDILKHGLKAPNRKVRRACEKAIITLKEQD